MTNLNIKRAWVENEDGSYNINFSVENRKYQIGETIENFGLQYVVTFDDPVAVRVKLI